jgi:3-deoxy-D-manno-octulosonic acid (KDO) 8-phosphate synthase
MNLSQIPQIKHIDSGNFFLLAGPCAIEGEEMALRIAEKLVAITANLEIPFVFKGSFKKANRSRIDSFSGIGDEKALRILRKVSETFQIPTVTDIHTNEDAEMAAQYVDVLQIPAFLVRQTDLVVAAAKTGKVINLKKGQFMSPESMKHAVQKVLDCFEEIEIAEFNASNGGEQQQNELSNSRSKKPNPLSSSSLSPAQLATTSAYTDQDGVFWSFFVFRYLPAIPKSRNRDNDD